MLHLKQLSILGIGLKIEQTECCCHIFKGYVPGVSFKVFRKPLSTEPVNRAQTHINIFFQETHMSV